MNDFHLYLCFLGIFILTVTILILIFSFLDEKPMPTIKRNHIKLERNSICPCEENEKREKPLKYKKCCLQKMVRQEQRAKQMINDNKEIEAMKKVVKDAMQDEIDHPILVPDETRPKLILPEDY